ncbi:MAG: 2-phospho-L-lactate transferase CofD family protein, partial [Ktedonobacterales bacterium]
TKHGETDNFTASDFVREIHGYLGGRVDRVIAHDGSFPDHLLAPYAAQAQHPVVLDEWRIRQLVPDVIVDQLLAIHHGQLVRHDADRLVRAIFTPPSFSL